MIRILSSFMAAGLASAHMGITDPQPLDIVIGDSFRNPVTAGDQATSGGGTCHGQGGGVVGGWTWIWTPHFSGQCEIYQNCFTTQPASPLTLSFGAAHAGGPCALYHCTGEFEVPRCERRALPNQFGTCQLKARCDDCSMKGVCEYDETQVGAAPDTITPTVAAPVGTHPPGGTASRIRCGPSWGEANLVCGFECISDAECPTPGDRCFADLADCPVPNALPVPDREIPHECEPITVQAGQTWTDVSIRYDTTVAELQAANPCIDRELEAFDTLEAAHCENLRQNLRDQGILPPVNRSLPGTNGTVPPGTEPTGPSGAHSVVPSMIFMGALALFM